MKLIASAIVVIAWATLAAAADKSRYDNYRVHKVHVKTEEQAQILAGLQEDGYDFWTDIPMIGHDADVMVAPHKRGEFSYFMDKYQFAHQIKIANVQELIDAEMPAEQPRNYGWESYYRVADIYAWLDTQLETHSDVLTGYVAGQSFEGRLIRGVKLSKRANNPAIFIEANTHAREWVTAPTATYLLNELLTSGDPEIQALANNYDWYIIPVMNPDGLEFTHTSTRLWRKTRSPNAGSTCMGTDANRNWDFQWMVGGGASTNPCSETFGGSAPFSEIEVASVAQFYNTIKHNVKLFLSFHSYGQYILYPYGHTRTPAANANDLNAMSAAFAAGVSPVYGTRYTYGATSVHLYIASGASPDWAYSQGTLAAFTLEFRDTGSTGFQLPAAQILPNARETIRGLKGMIAAAESLGYFE